MISNNFDLSSGANLRQNLVSVIELLDDGSREALLQIANSMLPPLTDELRISRLIELANYSGLSLDELELSSRNLDSQSFCIWAGSVSIRPQ